MDVIYIVIKVIIRTISNCAHLLLSFGYQENNRL